MVDSKPVDAGIQLARRWFSSQYPTLRLADEWLHDCVTFLQNELRLSGQALLKQVETQILRADLSDTTHKHADLLPEDEYNDQGGATLLFPDKKDAILVQILEMMEIGQPAHDLLKRHEARMEDRKMMKTEGRTVRRTDMCTEGTQVPEGDASGTQVPPNNAADATPVTNFPRHMLKLTVSDGFTTCYAIEVKRINELNLEDTELGCKLLLRGVKSRHGILMLDPANCTVKGGYMTHLNSRRDAVFTASLQRRLGADIDAEESDRAQTDLLTQAAPTVPTNAQPARRVASSSSIQPSKSGRTVFSKATTARSASTKPEARIQPRQSTGSKHSITENHPYDTLLRHDALPEEVAVLDQRDNEPKADRRAHDAYDDYLDDNIDEDAEALLAEIENRSQYSSTSAAWAAQRMNVVEIEDSSDTDVQKQEASSSGNRHVASLPKKKALAMRQSKAVVIDLD